MVEPYNALKGTQTEINRRLLRRIEALENVEADDIIAIAAAVEAVQEAIGDESDATSILGRIKALEDKS